MNYRSETHRGALFALSAAALFGISPVLAKLWAFQLNPPLLAGLLYLGSGLALLLVLIYQKIVKKQNLSLELKALTPQHRLKLIGAIIAGGILAPLAFTTSLSLASAFEISLLLNLETVATAAIAALVFKEHLSRRVIFSMGLLVIAVAASTIPWGTETQILHGSSPQWKGSAWVVLACIFWALDNNLTREVEAVPATVLTCIRGISAGSFNLFLSFLLFGIGKDSLVSIHSSVLAALGIGAVCYGVSLVLFVKSLRIIGSSRTATYFAVGPFWGIAFSLLLLSEKTAPHQWIAAAIGAWAVWFLYREHHEHVHTHLPLVHSHSHAHEDEHHQHTHDIQPAQLGLESEDPHTHFHSHPELTHQHSHTPDIHHRHSHGLPHKLAEEN